MTRLTMALAVGIGSRLHLSHRQLCDASGQHVMGGCVDVDGAVRCWRCDAPVHTTPDQGAVRLDRHWRAER